MSIKLSANVLGYCIFSIILTIHIGIGTYFIYYKYMNSDKKKQALTEVLSFRQQFTKHLKIVVKAISIKK